MKRKKRIIAIVCAILAILAICVLAINKPISYGEKYISTGIYGDADYIIFDDDGTGVLSMADPSTLTNGKYNKRIKKMEYKKMFNV